MTAGRLISANNTNLATIAFPPNQNYRRPRLPVEEIPGLITVYSDGHVDRPHIVPSVPATALPPDLINLLTCRDVLLDNFTNTFWARFYLPKITTKLPLFLYFHGGGFCVGSPSWTCYHHFLARLAINARCLIMSVNYRLAPENPLPAAYDDGVNSLLWLKRRALSSSGFSSSAEHCWWTRRCDFSRVFIGGDSAGANIAYNVMDRLGSSRADEAVLKPLALRGMVLIQPFFGGQARTESEKKSNSVESARSSALTVSASDTYWRLALPRGSNRDQRWCNPLAKGYLSLTVTGLRLFEEEEGRRAAVIVFVAEEDVLRDRNMEFGGALGKRAGSFFCCRTPIQHGCQMCAEPSSI
ncbi:Probable carboxylesterase 6 [Linum grandiflorum]